MENIDAETVAAANFAKYYKGKFKNKNVTFKEDTLEELMMEGKVVILFLYFNEDNFLEKFNNCLKNSEITKLITENCILIGWDMKTNPEALTDVLDNEDSTDLKFYRCFIESKKNVVLVKIREKAPSYFSDNLNEKNLLETLTKKVEENYIEITKRKLSSKQFQQKMMDCFGDQDYDNFDYFEVDYLKQKIGFALYGPPKRLNGYDKESEEAIEKLYNIILNENNQISKYKDRVLITFIFNSLEPLDHIKDQRKQENNHYDPEKDTIPRPIFVIRKCKGSENPCRIFIDEWGRVYNSWEKYLTENKLEECKMIFPKNGRYEEDDEGNILLEERLSPACSLTSKLSKTADTAAAVLGTAAGVAGVIGASAAVAPAVMTATVATGLASGIYALGRSATSLLDKKEHKEDTSFSNPEARGDYLNLAAGSLTFVGAGFNSLLGTWINQGANIGNGTRITINAINATTIAISGVGIANATYIILDQWLNKNQRPSKLAATQLALSILFFGHSVYNFQTVGTLIEESQTRILNDYEASLRSNRHRRMFKKLTKETIRQNGGQAQQGRAEVIRFVKNIDNNKDQVFAALTRHNKRMNRNGIKFAVHNEQLTLNGQVVDTVKFFKMNNKQVNNFFSKLPSTPQPTKIQIDRINVRLQKTFSNTTIEFDFNFVQNLLSALNNPTEEVMVLISNAVSQLLENLVGDILDYFEKNLPRPKAYFKLFEAVVAWLNEKMDEIEEKYEEWERTKDPTLEEPYFHYLPSTDKVKRMNEIFKIVSKMYYIGNRLNREGLKEATDFFITWCASRMFNTEEKEKRDQRRKEHNDNRKKVLCPICKGYFYNPEI